MAQTCIDSDRCANCGSNLDETAESQGLCLGCGLPLDIARSVDRFVELRRKTIPILAMRFLIGCVIVCILQYFYQLVIWPGNYSPLACLVFGPEFLIADIFWAPGRYGTQAAQLLWFVGIPIQWLLYFIAIMWSYTKPRPRVSVRTIGAGIVLLHVLSEVISVHMHFG